MKDDVPIGWEDARLMLLGLSIYLFYLDIVTKSDISFFILHEENICCTYDAKTIIKSKNSNYPTSIILVPTLSISKSKSREQYVNPNLSFQ